MDSESDEAPMLVAGGGGADAAVVAQGGSAGAVSGMTAFQLQELEKERSRAGAGVAGVDWTVPVTIVTGFLGSGKSTLIRRLLRERHDLKVAVMVNEFGAAGDIEKAMTVSQAGMQEDDWVELSNGCMCCVFKDRAVEALEGLVKRRGRFDAIVIETSGLADPAPLIAMLWQDRQLESPVVLDGVATLVDAKNVLEQLGRSSAAAHEQSEAEGGFVEATQQIALADRLVVNKTDLVGEERLRAVRAVLRELNPDAPIEHSAHGCGVDLRELLSIGRTQPKAPDLSSLQGLQTFIPAPGGHSHSHGAAAEPLVGVHTSGVGAVSVEVPGSLGSEQAVAALMKAVLWDTRDARRQGTRAPAVLRVKAKLRVGDHVQYVQGVGDLFDVVEGVDTGGPNQLVVIGRDLSLIDWRGLLQSHVPR